MDTFVWIPTQGMDTTSLDRLRAHSRRPSQPMGEAWFMGTERRMFTELCDDLTKINCFELQSPLAEIASGNICFGQREEWTGWFHFLFAQLLERAHENYVDSLLEYLITCFMTIYPSGVTTEPYPLFKSDVLATLGALKMQVQHDVSGIF